jgi:hypothetical protein
MRLLACLLVPTITAAAPGKRLEMRSTGHVHMEGCASYDDEAFAIVLDLRSDHRLAVTSTGKRTKHDAVEHVRMEGDVGYGDCYTHDEATPWSTSWTGRWTIAHDTLTLDLVLAKDTCTHTEADALKCNAADKQTRVTCSAEPAQLGDPAFSASELAIWRCRGRGLGESPERWVFGTTGCITVSGSRIDASSCSPR